MEFKHGIGKNPRTQVDTVSRQMLVKPTIPYLMVGQAVCYDDTLPVGAQPGVINYTASGKFQGLFVTKPTT